MFKKLIIGITFLFFFSSGMTWVMGSPGQGLTGRLTIAELFGAVIILLYFFIILTKKHHLKTNPIFNSLALLILSFFISCVFAKFSAEKAFFELLVIIFIFLTSLSMYNLWIISKIDLRKLLVVLIYSTSLLATIGLIDFFGVYSINSSSIGGLSGTFRNTGQAGTFFATNLAIIIPAMLSKKVPLSIVNILLIATIFIALFFTFKRAAYISVAFSLLMITFYFIFISKQKIKNTFFFITFILALSFLLFYLFSSSTNSIEGMTWRFEKKLTNEGLDNFKDGFWFENLKNGIDAFKTSPVIGIGLGNVAGNFSEKWEVHSTYVAILATGGILSIIVYLSFVSTWLRALFKQAKNKHYGKFITLLLIMIIGLFISWTYTYHIRKREFWILIALSSYIILSAKKSTTLIEKNNKKY